MTAYYNEFDPFAAAWLRNLIAAGHIAPGDVDERSIEDVSPDDLRPYTQCHFFAGIGVWSYAARRAGWPDDEPLWTGSAPCQPFSEAGAGGGFADKRHLWPSLHWLIEQRRPIVFVGEQVASTSGITWLDLVSTDLEGSGYAFGAAVLSAAGFGAGHPRHRSYFMADRGWTDTNGGDGYWRNSALQMGRFSQSGQHEKISLARRYEWGVEPRPSAVDHGPTARMELCRGYGNGLDARCATAFIEAVIEARAAAALLA